MDLPFKPVFILTSPRSGSTLFRLVLTAHPAISIAPPTWLYELFHGFLYSYGDLTQRPNMLALASEMLESPLIKMADYGLDAEAWIDKAREPSFRGLYEALHRTWAERENKIRWGQKTPRNAFYMREIVKDFPNAQFVHIVRDGRDVALDLSQSPNFRPDNLYAGANMWRRYVSAIRTSVERLGLDGDRYMEVKYEAFCADPEQECRKICAFLGEDYSAEMLLHHEKSETKEWSNHPTHAKTARPITTDYCDMWKTRLTEKDVAMITQVQREELRHYGYPADHDPIDLDPLDVAKWTENEIATAAQALGFKNELQSRREARAKAGVYDPSQRDFRVWGIY